jgi:Flp pilus assembly protein protease CpaA
MLKRSEIKIETWHGGQIVEFITPTLLRLYPIGYRFAVLGAGDIKYSARVDI